MGSMASSPWLLFPTAALALPDSILPAGSSSTTLYLYTRNFTSGLLQLIPHIFQGRFGLGELIRVMAFCSLFPGIYYLQKRRRESKSSSWTSGEKPDRDMSGADGRKSVDINGRSSGVSQDVAYADQIRRRGGRSRTLEEALDSSIVHDEPIYISFSASILSKTPASREVAHYTCAITSTRFYTWPRRVYVSIPFLAHKYGEPGFLSVN